MPIVAIQLPAAPVDCLTPYTSPQTRAQRKEAATRAAQAAAERRRLGISITAYPGEDLLPAGLAQGYDGAWTGVRFTLQPTGRATDCLVERASGVAALDAASCRLTAARVVSQPAIRDGRLVATTIRLAVQWPIPPSPDNAGRAACGDAGGAIPLFDQRTMPWQAFVGVLPTSDAVVQIRLSLSATGVPTTCEVVRAYATPAVRRRTCDAALATMRFLPALDPTDTPVGTIVYRLVRFGTGRS